jgi:hypothetical protein
MGALECAEAGRLDEVHGGGAAARQDEAETPKAVELRRQARPHARRFPTCDSRSRLRDAPLAAINHITGDALEAEIASKLLVLPSMIGSSPSSYIMLKLMAIGRAPAALILAEPDAILSFGGSVGRKGVLGEHSVDRRQRP